MTKAAAPPVKTGTTTYTFKLVVEPDDDVWHAYCPALQRYGAATWGKSQDEALRHIRQVVEMTVAELIEDGEAVPRDVQTFEEPSVSVTV